MSRALTLQALLVALLAASALASPLSMRRGLRAAGEKDESWVADEKTVEALKGVWKGELVSIVSGAAAWASATAQMAGGGKTSTAQVFVDATNLEKLIAASVPKGEAEAAIEAQKEMTPYFGVAGANPSGGQWLGALITKNKTATTELTGIMGYGLTMLSGASADAKMSGFSDEGAKWYEAFLEKDGTLTFYVYNTGAGDKSGGFVAQLTFTKTDLDTDEFLTGALAQLDGPAWDRPAMAAEEEEAEEKA